MAMKAGLRIQAGQASYLYKHPSHASTEPDLSPWSLTFVCFQGTTKCPLLLLCLFGSHLSIKTQSHCLWTVFQMTQSELSRCFAHKPLLWHRASCVTVVWVSPASQSWAIQGQGLGLVLVYVPGAQHWAWPSKYPTDDCCEEKVDEAVSLCS